MSRTTHIKSFAGVNLANKVGENTALACEMENFTVNSSGHLKKRPGIIKVLSSTTEIDGMWAGYVGEKYCFLVASNGNLMNIDPDTGEEKIVGYIGTGKCCMFEFGQKVYIINGSEYSCFDGNTSSFVSGYVPLIAIGCSPSGGGTKFENLNMLTPERRQQFSGDGQSKYQLAEKNISSVTKVTVDGTRVTSYSVDKAAGTVTFRADCIPQTGINNVEIYYTKGTSRRRMITANKHAMLFGGNVDCRVFLWGNPDHPNYRYYSDIADGIPSPEYFPVNNYSAVGNGEITDIISQYDRQLIFTKDMAFYSLCELRQDELGNYYSSFPVYNLNGSKGSLISGAGCVVNNEPITLCQDGLNRWTSTMVENEKNAVCFSHPIADVIWSVVRHANEKLTRLYNFQPNGELYFVYGDKSYIYNYNLDLWYVYSGFSPQIMLTSNGELYFSESGGVYKLDNNMPTDCGNPIHVLWRGPLCAFGEANRRKDIAFVSLSVEVDSRASFKVGVYDAKNYVPDYAVAEINDWGLYSYTMRGRKKRIDHAGICIDSEDTSGSFTVCSLSVTTQTKGETSKIGLH